MRIEKYKSGDEDAILELFTASFGIEMSSEFWQWRYKNNPHYDEQLIHLMWDGKKLAGHYALSPVKMLIDGVPKLTGLSMTTMTHPNYRGMGVFTNLANSVYEEAFDKHDLKFVWGFPNSNSHYGFINKLNWNDIGYVPMMSLNLNGGQKSTNHHINEISDFNEVVSVDSLFSRSSEGVITLLKDANFLNWRFFQNPENNYKAFSIEAYPETYLVYKEFENSSADREVDIVDYYLKNDKKTTQSYIEALVNICPNNVKKINTWVALNSDQHLWFERLSFQPTQPVTYFGRKIAPESSSVRNLTFSDLTMCYSDVF